MINELRISQFKAFREAAIELRPLTFFLGENNSGKSSILAALRLLAQTIQVQDLTIPLALSGLFGDFGSFRDVVYGNHRGRPIGLGITVQDKRRRTRPISSIDAEFKYRVQRRETVLRSTTLRAEGKPLLSVQLSKDETRPLLTTLGPFSIPERARAQLTRTLRMSHFVPRAIPELIPERSRSEDVNRSIGALMDVEHLGFLASQAVLNCLRRVEYIGAMRTPPERTYVNTGVAGRRIGADGSNWPGTLALDSSIRRSRRNRLTVVREWLQKAGIASDLSVSWLTDRHYEIVVTNPVTGETENIADVGQGTSQVVPVIVAGGGLEPDETFIVEEPEIHLHPRAQAALGDFFAYLTNRGVQSLVETHSEYLILRVQQQIAGGDLSPEDVIFYYVGSTPGGKAITPLLLDSTAAFRDQLPGGFFPQRVEEARKLVAARGRMLKLS